MKSYLLDSVRYFQEGDLTKSVATADLHFRAKFGTTLLKTSTVTEMKYAAYLEWDHFMVFCIKQHWSRETSLGIFFRELWNDYPSILFPYMIGKLDFMDFADDLYGEEIEAFRELNLSDLCTLLEDSCRDGKILSDSSDRLQSIFPTIDADYFEMLQNEQYSNYFAQQLKAAIERGFAQRQDNHFRVLATEHYGYVVRRLFILLFLGVDAVNRNLEEQIKGFSHRLPEQLELFSTALRNHMDSIPSDDDLSDFIFLYTGGRVLTEDPRGWMRLFIQSIETGNVLMPLG